MSNESAPAVLGLSEGLGAVSEACRTCGLLLAPWLRLYCTKCVQQHLKG